MGTLFNFVKGLGTGVGNLATGAYNGVAGLFNGAANFAGQAAANIAPQNLSNQPPQNLGGLNFSVPSTVRTVSLGTALNTPTSGPVTPATPSPISTNSQIVPKTVSGSQQSASPTNFLINDTPPPTSLTPQHYIINPGDTINSSSTNPTTTTGDALSAAADLRNQLMTGSNSSLTPSDSLLGTILGQIYQSSQYSPGEQTALSDYNDVSGKILATQLAEKRQVQQLYENGQMTKEQADAASQETQRRFNNDLANLAVTQGTDSLSLNTLGMLRQNQLGALQNVAGFLKPQEVQPGSMLINSLGQTVGQGTGVNPYNVQAAMSSMIQGDTNAGTLKVDPSTGGIDYNYYSQAASNLVRSTYGGQNGSYQSPTGSQSTQNPNSSPFTQSTTPVQPVEGQASGYGQNGFGRVDLIPQNLKNYFINTPIGGQSVSYVDGTRVPSILQQQVKTAAAAAGIPYFDSQDGVKAALAAQQILDIVDAAKALSIRNLKSGTGGHIQDAITNWANNFLQFNPDLSNFDQLRDAASKATTALAGGAGSGFRMNTGIIEAATNNLPRASDSLETALTRADALGTQVINGLSPLFPQLAQSSTYGNLLQSQYGNQSSQPSGGTTVQTKAGAINTNW